MDITIGKVRQLLGVEFFDGGEVEKGGALGEMDDRGRSGCEDGSRRDA